MVEDAWVRVNRVPAGAARRFSNSAGTERSAQGRAGFARRSEPLRASTVLAFPPLCDGRLRREHNVPVGELQSLYSQPAHCALRHRFLLPWAQNQTSICGLRRGIRRHRRLSLDLPASLETRTWRHREVDSLAQSPKLRGLAGLRSPCISATVTLCSRALRRHLGCRRESFFSAIYCHEVSH